MTPINLNVLNILKDLSTLNRQFGYEYINGGDEFTSPKHKRGMKAFVVGLIPPDVYPNFKFVEKHDGTIFKVLTVEAQQAPTGQAEGKGGAKKSADENIRAWTKEDFDSMVIEAAKEGIDPKMVLPIIEFECGFSTSAMPPAPNVAKGLIQFTTPALQQSGISKEKYATFEKLSVREQIPHVFKYFRAGKPPGGWKDSGQMYTYVIASGALVPSGYGMNKDYVIYSKEKSFKQWDANHKSLSAGSATPEEIRVSDMYNATERMKRTSAYMYAAAQIDEAVQRVSSGRSTLQTGTVAGGPPVPYVGIMSSANDITDSVSDNPMEQIGQNLQAVNADRQKVADRFVAELEQQINAAKLVPSLVLYVNPKNFKRHYEHQVDYVKGRRRPITSMHLEKPVTLSGNGTTGAQFSVRSEDGAGGLSHQNRVASLSYLNLMSLVSLYRNNGVLHTSIASDNDGVPTIAMSCFMYYDRKLYIGSFDSFGVTDEKPFSMDYEFQFTVRYETDIALNTSMAATATSGMTGITEAGR